MPVVQSGYKGIIFYAFSPNYKVITNMINDEPGIAFFSLLEILQFLVSHSLHKIVRRVNGRKLESKCGRVTKSQISSVTRYEGAVWLSA